MKYALVLVMTVFFAACNNADKTDVVEVPDTASTVLKSDNTSKYIHTFSDTVLERKITDTLFKLPFVIQSNHVIDSISNHKQGIAFMVENPAAGETEIPVKAGYNGKERFETYYRFFVNPKTMEIKVYDPVADKKLTLKEFQKTQQ